VISNPKKRKPRILWANAFCLLDTSSGASIDAREMLRQLFFCGYEVSVVGATVFDSEKGVSRLPVNWRTSVTDDNNVLKVVDAPLEHTLIATKSLNRLDMTARESDQWYSLYVQTIESFKPDLVFFYGGQAMDFLISDEARQRGIPCAMYLANGNFNGTRWCRDVDLVITNSQTNAEFYYRKDGITSIPVGLFIDQSAIKAVKQTRKHLLFVNPSIEKGAGIVIQLAMLLEKKRADIQFEVVESRGNWSALVKHITSHYGESPREKLDNVLVTPNTTDMRPIYGRARLLLAPSLWWESAGRVAAEAMLNGIPAIVTDHGGLPEMIGSGGLKLKLPEVCYEKPYTSLPQLELLQPLVEKIIQLYDNEALYNDYVARARHVGDTMHNMRNSTQRLMQAFQPFLEKSAGDKGNAVALEKAHKQGPPAVHTTPSSTDKDVCTTREPIRQPTKAETTKLQSALTLQQQGKLAEAEALYREILQSQPDHLDALQLLAAIAGQKRNFTYAIELLDRALNIDPHHLSSLNNRGVALQEMKRNEEALLSYDRVIAIKPDYAQAYSNRGVALKDLKRYEEALTSFDRAVELKPDYAEAYSNRAVVLQELKRYEEARISCEKAMVLKPDDAAAYSNRGNALMKLSRYGEALLSYDKAIALKPDYAQAYSNRGVTLYELKRYEEALISYDKAIALQPDHADAYTNRGVALRELMRYEEALASHEKAIAIQPDYGEAHSNLGNVFQGLGMLHEAEVSYRRAMELKPNYVEGYSNLLFSLNYSAGHQPSYLYGEACRYGQMVTQKVGSSFLSWQCKPDPERLRIGVVSGDLASHPVGYFLEGIVAQIDQTRIELIAYPTVGKCDELTERIKPFFSAWKSLVSFEDEAAARLIHTDGVHVLLDLAGHTAKNRLPVFAYKPAPVQVSWLGYSGTTGLPQMDYYLADPYASPSDEEKFFSETIYRLPESYLCYTPPAVPAGILPLPALTSGHITFGCFNNLTKVNDAVVALWSRVLHALPSSKLFLRTKQLQNSRVCDTFIQRFAEHGITSSRLILDGTFSSRLELFEAYNRVDIALDSFPYTGTTTSVEGLWMGVPVITRKGDRFISRIGESIAQNAGLADWIADNDDDFVAKAVLHTRNLDRLAELRAGLRERVLASPLFNAPRFARNFENALWDMWKQYESRKEL